MAAKRGKGAGADDLAKFIKKLFKSQAPAKVRYELQKGLEPAKKRAQTSMILRPEKVAPTKARPISKGSNIKTTEPTIKTTKVPKTAPKREKKYVKLDRERGGIVQTEAQKRTASKEAARWLRAQKDLERPKPPVGHVPVGSEIPRVKKRSKSGRKPPTSAYEGDVMRRQAAEDRRRIGRGQPMPKKPKGKDNPPPAGGAKVKPKPKPKKPSGGASKKVVSNTK